MSRAFALVMKVPVAFLILASCCTFAADKNAKESPAEAKARQDVKAALQAEAAGDNSLRAERLASAAGIAPESAEANWHLGKVRASGKWLSLSDAEQQSESDAQAAEYRKQRNEAEGNSKLLRGLARWCLKNGWNEEAKLHYAQLLSRNDIDEETRKEAIRRLDLRLVGSGWITGEQLKAQEKRATAIDNALRQWRPRLKRLQVAVDEGDYATSERAINELNEIDDPQAIIALESFQLDGGDRFCEEAVKRLAKFPQVEATEALVHFAVLSSFSGTRDAAARALKQRPKHDYVPLLLAGLTEPVKSQFSITVGRNGVVQYTHAIQQENANQRAVNVSSHTAMPYVYRPMYGRYEPGFTSAGFVMAQLNQAQQAAVDTEIQREQTNFQLTEANRRVFQALEAITDQQFPRQPQAWWQWWQQYNQYDWPKPTQWAYQSIPRWYYGGLRTSCFLAGTLVRAQAGLVPIESLHAGDRVLSQDQDTGELAYKLVVRTTIRPPSAMTRIKTIRENIVTTLGHPFWVNGHGWKMAKELSAGDLLHSLCGAVKVEKVEPEGEDKAYNLVVDDFNTYFVGQQGLLVHDNAFRRPTRAIVPGLVEDVVSK